ncbi:DUF5522 domain-containing protein [Cyclobacterium amurskyense]|jgi:hypothetical protein|uniref:DUF5522 domain-containing protein n=1 Tax=Cyclobacterium amurskyense TaxID=320787 RepID=UPI000AE53611|nr:DUF5522 domain-containing protein [Cyclobacterium amurskyense]|tara:strand:+ start:17886 stop:18056 length:171 start_codon:yes stop_codon:yes gene_type:complete
MPKENKLPPPQLLKEGLHYYFEDGLMVFTKAYHLLRGKCCGSGCRHCPYPSKDLKQ